MDVKERIINGALEMIMRYGVRAVTMDDIARQLGISKKTIYQFFENKDKLVLEITNQYLAREEETNNTICVNAENAILEIFRIMEHLQLIFRSMNPSLLYEIEKYHPQAWTNFTNYKKNCIHHSIAENLRKGIEQGLYRKDLDIEFMTITRIETMMMGFNPTIFPPAKYLVSEVQTHLLDHFLHGICTIKGHKLINKYKNITEE